MYLYSVEYFCIYEAYKEIHQIYLDIFKLLFNIFRGINLNQYNTLFYQKSNYKRSLNVFYSIYILIFLAAFLFIIINTVPENDDYILLLLSSIVMFMLILLFAYLFIFGGILKKFYIEVTSDYLKVSLPFKSNITYWKDVYDAGMYESKNNLIIAILLEKDKIKKTRRTIFNSLSLLYGAPPSSFQIPLGIFKDIDSEKLFEIIIEQIDKNNVSTEINAETYKENTENITKAIISSGLCFIILEIIYEFIIHILDIDYAMIAVLGCMLIIASFNKYYIEKSFNIFVRLWVGFLCLIQIPVAIIGAPIIQTIMSQGFIITIADVINISRNSFYYFMNDSSGKDMILYIVLSFIIGAFNGRVYTTKS